MLSHPTRSARPRAAAFTLVELLTVIAIVGILAGLVLMGLGKVRTSARQSGCLSNLRQLGVTWQVYLGDNRGRFPEFAIFQMYYWGGSQGTWTSPPPETRPLYPYLPDPKPFQCPSDVEEGGRDAFYKLSGNSYVMANSAQRGLLSRPEAKNRVAVSGYYSQLQHPAKTIMVFEHTVRASELAYKNNPTASYFRNNWHNNDTSNMLMADGHVETFQRAVLDAYVHPINPPGYTWGWSHYSGPDW